MTIITNAKKEAILPPAGDLKAHHKADCNYKKHFYSLNGTTHISPELVFGDLTNEVSMSRNHGMDRIGSVVRIKKTVEQHVLMCMCGMLKKRH